MAGNKDNPKNETNVLRPGEMTPEQITSTPTALFITQIRRDASEILGLVECTNYRLLEAKLASARTLLLNIHSVVSILHDREAKPATAKSGNIHPILTVLCSDIWCSNEESTITNDTNVAAFEKMLQRKGWTRGHRTDVRGWVCPHHGPFGDKPCQHARVTMVPEKNITEGSAIIGHRRCLDCKQIIGKDL